MRILIILSVIAFSYTMSFAGGNLKTIISKADTASSYTTFDQLGQEMEKITPSNNNNWLYYYWGAYNFAMSGYLAPKIKKDAYLDKADNLIAKAMKLSPTNVEIYILQSWIHSSRIAVAPASRAKIYGEKSKVAHAKALSLSPSNPRCSFIQAASLYHTPPAMGGGRAKAKPHFEEALDLFSKFTPKSDTHPDWGLKQTQKYLQTY